MEALGFKRTRGGWARLGGIGQAEFQFLSSEIVLIGFRRDKVIDIPLEQSPESMTPVELVDEILSCWQKKYQGIESSLMLEHGQVFTRGRIWSFVEQAVEGALTPESETILGFAMESLRAKSVLPPEVQALELKLAAWRGETSLPDAASRGIERTVIRERGSFINWVDDTGRERSGRLARHLRTGDDDLLVYSDSPRWAGGYVVAAPLRILKKALLLTHVQAQKTDVSPRHESEIALEREDARQGAQQVSSMPDVNSPSFDELYQTVIAQESGRLYSGDMFTLIVKEDSVLPGRTEQLLLSIAIKGEETDLPGLRTALLKLPANPEMIRTAVSEIEHARTLVEADLREISVILEQCASSSGKSLPLHAVLSGSNGLEHLVTATNGYLSPSLVYRVLSSVLRSGKLESYANVVDFDNSLSLKYLLQGKEHFASIAEVTLESVDVSDVAEAVSNLGDVSTNWVASLKKRHNRLFRSTDGRGRVQYHAELKDAVQSLAGMLRTVAVSVDAAVKMTLDEHASYLENYELLAALRGIPGRLRELDDLALRTHVKADLHRLGGTRVLKLPEAQIDLLVSKIADVSRKDGIWGVTLELKSKSTYVREVAIDKTLIHESRAAVIGMAVSEIKDLGGRSVVIGFDSVSWVDPDLVRLINGEDSPSKLKSVADSEGNSSSRYADTGVVAGLAAKDIRGFNKQQLIANAELMSDSQKANYITKDVLWPRMSYEHMKEKGAVPGVAMIHSMIWKAVDSSPKSLASQHVLAFIDLIEELKKLDRYVDLPASEYQIELNQITSRLFSNGAFRLVQEVYSGEKNLRIRGVNATLKSKLIFDDHAKFIDALSQNDWHELLAPKERRVAVSAASRVRAGDVERFGPDYRMGKSVTGEDFIRTFGFSGVEYGNWTTQLEREKHLNFAYDSMLDFVESLGWEPMSLSLGGRLGLCFGSRGKGGPNAADAHFESVNMAINLTRMRGDGSLARAYFLAVSNHFGRLYKGQSVDLADAMAGALKSPGDVNRPSVDGDLRGNVAAAFFNAMTSIMRAPAISSDLADLSKYTERSRMLITSIGEDGVKKRIFWSRPAEMFARSAEAWLSKQLEVSGRRNDYLVRREYTGDAAGLYPSNVELERIGPFMSEWVASIRSESRKVNHPFLGSIEMPVLNSKMHSVVPLALDDLRTLAEDRLNTLFRSARPDLEVFESNEHLPGMYDLTKRIIRLNALCADEGTFNHESWHAAREVLLTRQEIVALDSVFSVDSDLARRLHMLMCADGHSTAAEHMLQDTEEVQAYAYQYWAAGKLKLDTEHGSGFIRTSEFVSGALEVCETFGEAVVESIFTRFSSGALAERLEWMELHHQDVEAWDSDNIVWNFEAPDEPVRHRARGITLR